MFEDFKKFIMRGNVLDLAIGFIMGAAFSKVVTSVVNDLLMPVIGLGLKGVDFSNFFISLNGKHYDSLAAAKADKPPAPTLNYGLFVNTVVEFLIVAFAVYLIVKAVARLYPPPTPAAVTTKECPECCSAIPLGAKRCPACTAQLAVSA